MPADHANVCFDVDRSTGVLQAGVSAQHWYKLGLQAVLKGVGPTSGQQWTHHPQSGKRITGGWSRQACDMWVCGGTDHVKVLVKLARNICWVKEAALAATSSATQVGEAIHVDVCQGCHCTTPQVLCHSSTTMAVPLENSCCHQTAELCHNHSVKLVLYWL